MGIQAVFAIVTVALHGTDFEILGKQNYTKETHAWVRFVSKHSYFRIAHSLLARDTLVRKSVIRSRGQSLNHTVIDQL